MKYIILCENNSLLFIHGRHMIEYVIESIPSNEIFIIYNIFLDEYNFQEILINKCKSTKIHFTQIDYITRGNVETALIGINNFIKIIGDNDNIVFIDNNNLHNFCKKVPIFENDFIGYNIDYSNKDPNFNYSFIRIENNKIAHIEENNKISNFYCCGLYGFKNINNFKKYALILFENPINKFKFSELYNLIIKNNFIIEPYFIEKTQHIGAYKEIIKNTLISYPSTTVNQLNNKIILSEDIGSYNEIINNTLISYSSTTVNQLDNKLILSEDIGSYNEIINNNIFTKQKLRICFDLDNTLVTYPTTVGDYSTVKPINKNIKLLKNLKKDGHEIIIYTARRMKTHNGNIGKVIKDIAGVTIDTLEKLNIDYDELIFGKPIADIYIDDRAINPYINDISYFGLFYDTDQFISNKIKNNKYNKIKKCDEYIIKTGPHDVLKGELYYYQNIPNGLKNYFPKLYNYNKNDNYIELKIDYIEGIPLYYLYKNNLLTYKHIDELFDILNKFHSHKDEIIITHENIKNNYINKLKKRFNINKQDYYFDDSENVLCDIIEGIKANFSPVICPMIHGDFWFSNIILTYDNHYKCIDMKGIIDDIFTLNGDIYYDYGKLYQSILGYDLIINNIINYNNEYICSMKTYFLNKCHSKGLNINYLKYVTKSLVFGTLPFISHYDNDIKNNVWDFIKVM
jgi:capsule biosynthesis phosphatase